MRGKTTVAGQRTRTAWRWAASALVRGLKLVLPLTMLLFLLPAWAEVGNPKGVAVIIGNGDYEHRDVPDVKYAHRDAEAFRRYVVDVLGFDPENVVELRDASRRVMYDALGTRRDIRSDLWSYLDPEGGSDVVVFYSGHGVPGEKDKRGYLLPVDADPKAAEQDGYPIDLLYSNLARLSEAKTVRVYVDSCFSGGSHEGGLIRDASPVYVQAALPSGTGGKVTSLTAATGEQIASWDADAQHGLFTHHLLDALYGKADANRDGRVTAKEAKVYLDRWMTRAARRKHRRIQQATLMGREGAVLTASPEGNVYPERPKFGERPARNEGTTRGRKKQQFRTGMEATQPVSEKTAVSAPRSSQRRPGQVFRDCPECPRMVVVPPGTFMMGSPVTERDRFQDENPQHQVKIPGAFAVGKYEVTLAEWDACVSAGGCGGYSAAHWGSVLDHPVTDVSWHDAKAYVEWLSTISGKTYRLLSESEWEYAARAGTTGRFHFSGRARDGINYRWCRRCSGVSRGPTVVGSFPANDFGLHDVHGNVREWVEDCYHANFNGAPADGSPWVSGGNCGTRVSRGGSWEDSIESVRSAGRYGMPSGYRSYENGFRVARTLTP